MATPKQPPQPSREVEARCKAVRRLSMQISWAEGDIRDSDAAYFPQARARHAAMVADIEAEGVSEDLRRRYLDPLPKRDAAGLAVVEYLIDPPADDSDLLPAGGPPVKGGRWHGPRWGVRSLP